MNFVIENHIQHVPEEADFLLEVARINQQIFNLLQERSDRHQAAKVKAAEIAKSLAETSARMAR